MKDIRVDVGVHTVISVNLEDFDFTGINKVIFTVKNTASYKSEEIIEREFTEAKMYDVTITPDESIRLTNDAVYDFNAEYADGTRRKVSNSGRVILRMSVGDCIED